MTKKQLTDEQIEALREIEQYWRIAIGTAIFEAAGKLKPKTVAETFEVCEKIARGEL